VGFLSRGGSCTPFVRLFSLSLFRQIHTILPGRVFRPCTPLTYFAPRSIPFSRHFVRHRPLWAASSFFFIFGRAHSAPGKFPLVGRLRRFFFPCPSPFSARTGFESTRPFPGRPCIFHTPLFHSLGVFSWRFSSQPQVGWLERRFPPQGTEMPSWRAFFSARRDTSPPSDPFFFFFGSLGPLAEPAGPQKQFPRFFTRPVAPGASPFSSHAFTACPRRPGPSNRGGCYDPATPLRECTPFFPLFPSPPPSAAPGRSFGLPVSLFPPKWRTVIALPGRPTRFSEQIVALDRLCVEVFPCPWVDPIDAALGCLFFFPLGLSFFF